MKLHIQSRFSLAIVSLVLFLLLSLAATLYFVGRDGNRQLTESGLHTMTEELQVQMKRQASTTVHLLAATIAGPLASGDIDKVREIIATTRGNRNIVELQVFSTDGRLLTVDDQMPAGGQAIDMVTLLAAGQGITETSVDRIMLTRPILHEGRVEGALRVALTQAHISNARARLGSELYDIGKGGLRHSLLALAVTILLWALVGVAITGAIGHRLIRPIRELRRCVRQVGRGDYDVETSSDHRDEIGEFMDAFREMGRNLQKKTVSRDFVRSIVRSMTNALIVLKPDGTIRTVNDITCRLLQYSSDELVGQSFDLLMPEGSSVTSYIGDLTAPDSIISSDEVLVRRDGEQVHVTLTASLIHDTSGTPAGILCIAHDITELTASQRQLELALHDAEAANRTKSRFLNRMSHELRTPMNGVLGMTDLLLATSLDNQQHQYTLSARNAGRRLLAMIDDVLDFSKIETGQFELQEEAFDVANLVEEAAGAMAERAHGKGLELSCDIDNDVPAVYGDSGRLRQILTHLIDNSVKFTGNGEICVTAVVEEQSDTLVRLRFTVQDTGIGVPPEDHEAIFNLFSQVDESAARREDGSGLGLAICRELVVMMGGRIGVDSEFGKGACFWFTIEATPVPHAPTALLRDAELAEISVLGIDGNRTSQRVLERYVTGIGATYCPATSLDAAAAMLGRQAFNVIFIDQRLLLQQPDQLVALTASGARAVLLISGELSAEFVGKCLSLQKPIGRAALRASLLRDDIDRGAADEVTFVFEEQFAAEILIVEDNRINQEFAKTLLELHGCTVTVVDNGLQALEAQRCKKFDIIFMDCQMPEMDGYEATRRIREEESRLINGTRRHVPIIAVTANAMSGDRENCLAAGMDDYLAKPFTRQELVYMLTHWLGGERTGEAPLPPSVNREISTRDELIDMSVLNDLRMLERTGAESVFHDVVSMYLQDSAGFIESLNAAVSTQNAADLREAAHALKSCSGNVGAMGIMSLSAALEAQALSNSLTGAPDMMHELEAMYNDVCVALASELQDTR
ncbi:MAG: response regulator [Lentisphaeria bacterium]|nr:response regulator [Lentisphaeria bacterium]